MSAAIVALLVVFCPRVVLAQEPSEPGSGESASESPDASDAEARAMFEAGRTAFEAGLYENALESFEQAAELTPNHAELHYNVGLTAERLRRDERAATAYRRFLQLDPSSSEAAQVRARLRILEEASPQETPTGQSPPSNTLPIVSFVVAGAAVAGAALSAIWLVDRIDALDPCDQPGMACQHQTTVETERDVAIGTLIGSSTIAIVMLVLGLATWDSGEPDQTAWTCEAGRGCALRF